MKLGISQKIDVTKIDKSRLHKGEKGTYMDIVTFIDTDNPSQYGDHGFISQSVSKEEREQGIKTPILGNTKVFYFDNNKGSLDASSGVVTQEKTQAPPPPFDDAGETIDDLPF